MASVVGAEPLVLVNRCLGRDLAAADAVGLTVWQARESGKWLAQRGMIGVLLRSDGMTWRAVGDALGMAHSSAMTFSAKVAQTITPEEFARMWAAYCMKAHGETRPVVHPLGSMHSANVARPVDAVKPKIVRTRTLAPGTSRTARADEKTRGTVWQWYRRWERKGGITPFPQWLAGRGLKIENRLVVAR